MTGPLVLHPARDRAVILTGRTEAVLSVASTMRELDNAPGATLDLDLAEAQVLATLAQAEATLALVDTLAALGRRS